MQQPKLMFAGLLSAVAAVQAPASKHFLRRCQLSYIFAKLHFRISVCLHTYELVNYF